MIMILIMALVALAVEGSEKCGDQYCPAYSTCINYECVCDHGFKSDHGQCVRIKEPVNQCPAQCPPGPTGPTGPQGPQGPTGPKGDEGDEGKNGDKGDKGDPGMAGRDGQNGVPGVPGASGCGGCGCDKGGGGKVVQVCFKRYQNVGVFTPQSSKDPKIAINPPIIDGRDLNGDLIGGGFIYTPNSNSTRVPGIGTTPAETIIEYGFDIPKALTFDEATELCRVYCKNDKHCEVAVWKNAPVNPSDKSGSQCYIYGKWKNENLKMDRSIEETLVYVQGAVAWVKTPCHAPCCIRSAIGLIDEKSLDEQGRSPSLRAAYTMFSDSAIPGYQDLSMSVEACCTLCRETKNCKTATFITEVTYIPAVVGVSAASTTVIRKCSFYSQSLPEMLTVSCPVIDNNGCNSVIYVNDKDEDGINKCDDHFATQLTQKKWDDTFE